jgi:hypothetical protein
VPSFRRLVFCSEVGRTRWSRLKMGTSAGVITLPGATTLRGRHVSDKDVNRA